MPPEGPGPGDPREWLRRARNNLARSSQGQVTADVLFEDACFDAQQAVEKALKACSRRRLRESSRDRRDRRLVGQRHRHRSVRALSDPSGDLHSRGPYN